MTTRHIERQFWINKTTEECAEVIQALAKVLNYGEYKVNPNNGINNKTHLETEIGELRYCLDQLAEIIHLDDDVIIDGYRAKEKKIFDFAGDSEILAQICVCPECRLDKMQQEQQRNAMRIQKYNDDEVDMDGRC